MHHLSASAGLHGTQAEDRQGRFVSWRDVCRALSWLNTGALRIVARVQAILRSAGMELAAGGQQQPPAEQQAADNADISGDLFALLGQLAGGTN